MRQAGIYSGMLCGGNKTGPHLLPLARIKKIMKRDGAANMISGEAPIVFAKACELFIQELTRRSWMVTVDQAGKPRKTLHKDDVVSAVLATDVFDFLVTLVVGSQSSHPPATAGDEEAEAEAEAASALPHYYI